MESPTQEYSELDDLVAAASVLAMEVDSDAQDAMEQEDLAGARDGDLLQSNLEECCSANKENDAGLQFAVCAVDGKMAREIAWFRQVAHLGATGLFTSSNTALPRRPTRSPLAAPTAADPGRIALTAARHEAAGS